MEMLTKDFSIEEFKCPCCDVCKMDETFIAMLQDFREIWIKPMHINSGFRCPKHNAEMSGSMHSQHLLGKAADIRVVPEDRYAMIQLAFELGFTGIGLATNFIHLDSRVGKPSIWKY